MQLSHGDNVTRSTETRLCFIINAQKGEGESHFTCNFSIFSMARYIAPNGIMSSDLLKWNLEDLRGSLGFRIMAEVNSETMEIKDIHEPSRLIGLVQLALEHNENNDGSKKYDLDIVLHVASLKKNAIAILHCEYSAIDGSTSDNKYTCTLTLSLSIS